LILNKFHNYSTKKFVDKPKKDDILTMLHVYESGDKGLELFFKP